MAGGVEIFLRVTTERLSDLYAGCDHVPDIADTCFRRVYLENYERHTAWNDDNYDPQLGWDYEIARSRTRGGRAIGAKSPDVLRIVTLGDSFTWGIDVNDDECYPQLLEQVLRQSGPAEVLNMGVGSYGLDQMVLKYEQHGRALRPDIVVVGIYTHDYDRTRLSFYSASKPVYQRDAGGQWTLANVPVPPPQELHAFLKTTLLRPRSFAAAYTCSRAREVFSSLSGHRQYYRETDALVEFLLTRLRDDLARTGTKLLVMHIPRGEAFENPRTIAWHRSEPRVERLRAIHARLGIPYLDLLEELPKQHDLATIHREYYLRCPDGDLGHFSPVGNAEIARLLAQHPLIKRRGGAEIAD